MTSRCYTTTGGLVFFVAALSLLLTDNASSGWSVPRNFVHRQTNNLDAPCRRSHPATLSAAKVHPKLSHAARRTALFSSPRPLATEGDWAAYHDDRYDRVYYFNHITGESVWTKPTPSFPDVNDGGNVSDRSSSGGFGAGNPDVLNAGQDTLRQSSTDEKPTLYQILNLPPTASRNEIKRSYLDLAKMYHPDAVAKRGGDVEDGNRVFNDIARAWMILSDEGLRRGYDESLGIRGDNNQDPGDVEESGGIVRDAIIIGKNKFEKNPVYKKKIEMASKDNRGNKFARVQQRSPPSSPNDTSPPQSGRPNVITPAPPLEIDYEAEAAAAQSQQRQQSPYPRGSPLTASQATLMAQNAWRDAITAEKASLQRDAQSTSEELREAEFQARRWNDELEEERRREMRRQELLRQEKRRRSSERSVMDGEGRRGLTIEERLRMRKMQKAEEAERVGRELTRLGGLSGEPGNDRGGMGMGALNLGGSEKPDAFFGMSSRPLTKSTSNIREEQRLNSLQRKGAAASTAPPPPGQGQGKQQRNGPLVAERQGVVASQSPPSVEVSRVSTSDVEKEMNQLKERYEAEIDRLKTEMMQIADKSQSEQLKELVKRHRNELERVKYEMEMESDERLEYELGMLEERHANEMEALRRGMGGDPAFMDSNQLWMGSNDRRDQEMESVINNLKEEHAMEVRKLKEEMSKIANYDQSEKLQEIEESHKKAMEQLKADMEAAAAQELRSELEKMEAAHKWQLQNLQSGHDAAMLKSQKEAGEKLRWEVERSIESLKRQHEREIERLKNEAALNVSESDVMEAMKLNHQAEMETLRAELFGEAARELEEAILSLNNEHEADIARIKATMEQEAEEQMRRVQQEAQAGLETDLRAKTLEVEKVQQKDIEQVKRQVLENARFTESEQIKRLEAIHRQEIEDLKRGADRRLEEEILKIAQLHAREITKLRDDLEASAANTIRDIQTESARQRQIEVERAISWLQAQQEQERARVKQELMREIEQEVGTKVFSQKADMERLKSELDLQSKQVMAAEITKLKQAHIGEMERMKKEAERYYTEKMEQLKKDMNQKKRSEMDIMTKDLKQKHAMELERVSEEASRSSNANLQRELTRVAEEHKRAMENLRNDLNSKAAANLNQRIEDLTRAHRNEIEELKNALRLQTQANVQRTAEVEDATQKLREAHQKELELLRKSMMVNASSSEKERMEVLSASHRAEMERTKAQLEASFAKKLENELQQLEQAHQLRLNDLRDELNARSRALADKESLMQTNQAKQLQQVQSEMQALKEAHAAEILSLKSNMLKNSDAAYQKQIDDLTATFNAELERVKAAASRTGGTRMAGLGSAPFGVQGKNPQTIEEVLNSLRGVYPTDVIEKLRQDLTTKDAALSRMNKNINDKTEQMNLLQSKLNASEQSQQTLSRTIQSLESWKQKAETDIKEKTNQLQLAKSEVERLKREAGMRARSSEELAVLQKEIRAKNNEVVNLTNTIQKLTKETADMKSRLDAIAKEKAMMTTEINQLSEWKRKAEADQKKERENLESQISRLQQELTGTKDLHKQQINELDNKLREEAKDKRSVIEKFTRDMRSKDDQIKTLEGNLSNKDKEINTLKHGLRERNEDVNTLVPEVARLQTLNAEMKAVNDARLKEFSALKAEAERLKVEFEKGNNANLATVKQLTAKLESEQTKHAEFIANLEKNVKEKSDEIVGLQSTLNDKTKKITDLEKRLGTMSKMSADLASLEEYKANTEKSIAESRQQIQALKNDLARVEIEDAEKKARIIELERLQKSMFGKDGEIQRLKKDLAASGEEISSLRAKLNVSLETNKRMAQDIAEFKSARYSSEASLRKTTDELAVAQREVERLKREIEAIKKSDQIKTSELKDLQMKLIEKESQLRAAVTSKDSEISSLNASVNTFASERERLLAELSKLSDWKSNAEETIATQCNKIELINSQLQSLERGLQNSTNSSEYETLLKERASLIQQLASVKNELVQKTDQIKTTKVQTEALLRKAFNSGSSPLPGTSVRTVRTPILSNNVVIGEFTSRKRNIAVAPESPSPNTAVNTVAKANASVSVVEQQTSSPLTNPEKVAVSPPNPPTLSGISSTMAATLSQAKPKSSANTMDAYDLALAQSQQSKSQSLPPPPAEAKMGVAPGAEAKSDTASMSGWAGYKDEKWGGYLDNLSNKNPGGQKSTGSNDNQYKYKDDAQKGFGYLDNLSAKRPAEQSSSAFLDAEKKYLLEAKNLALSAAKSFQEAQLKPNDKDALAKASSEKVKVDELLAKAKEMREKAEEISKSP
eukprot:CCRYP_003981-RA/>CCRYP_003981-RA protein AED:0.02 eAED:0.02 QI:0/0/0/1/1/1/7/0/2290